MKNMKTIILSLLAFALSGKAQTVTTIENEIVKKDISLYIVIKSEDSADRYCRDLLTGDAITKFKILSREEMKQNYPTVKADMISIVQLKPGVKLWNLTQLLDKYEVPQQYRTFKVAKDGLEVEDPKTLLVSEDHVTDIIIDKEKRYINIITKSHKKMLEWRKAAREDRLKLKKQVEDRRNQQR